MQARRLKHYISETYAERCVDCPGVITCLRSRNGEWRCRLVMDKDADGRNTDFREIPEANLQGDFPEWCPLATITDAEWRRHCGQSLKEKSKKLLSDGGQ